VVFAGAGTLGQEISELGETIEYAGGAGLRIKVSKDFGLDLSIDEAINKDGETTTYVYVGQRF
jgi:hypothetical protein